MCVVSFISPASKEDAPGTHLTEQWGWAGTDDVSSLTLILRSSKLRGHYKSLTLSYPSQTQNQAFFDDKFNNYREFPEGLNTRQKI